MAEGWRHPLSLPGAREAWEAKYADWWDQHGCCTRCGWHKSSHTDTGYGRTCSSPTNPAAKIVSGDGETTP